MDKIMEILEYLYPKRSLERPSCTCGTLDKNHDCVRKAYIYQARSAILKAFEEMLPKEKQGIKHKEFSMDNGSNYSPTDNFKRGFNACLAEIKEKLKKGE